MHLTHKENHFPGLRLDDKQEMIASNEVYLIMRSIIWAVEYNYEYLKAEQLLDPLYSFLIVDYTHLYEDRYH